MCLSIMTLARISAQGSQRFSPRYQGRFHGRLRKSQHPGRCLPGRKSESADKAGSQIRQNITKQVGCHDDVKLIWIHDELHCHIIDDLLLRQDIGVRRSNWRATSRKSPLVSFRMFALCTAVTFFLF
jgi:hypothetical protein